MSLSKTVIGDYLGEDKEHNIKVMHAYVDSIDFTELEFDVAIRRFLKDFRLRRGSKKIDRMMENRALLQAKQGCL